MAWHAITLALSLAQVLGLNRRHTKPCDVSDVSAVSQNELDRMWWCVYILERTLSVELERRSAINDQDCNLQFSSLHSQEPGSNEFSIFVAAASLARIQGQVMDRLLQSRAAEEGETICIENAICEKMRAIGQFDTTLQQWACDRPDGLRPDDYMDCDPNLLPAVAHLALQYHKTQLMLSRHALIVDPTSIRPMVAQRFANEPFRHRLANGYNICGRSLRAIVAILGHLHDSRTHCLLFTLHAPLLAVYGLTLQIIGKPSAVTVNADSEAQDIACKLIEKDNDRMHGAGIECETELFARTRLLQRLREIIQGHLPPSSHGTNRANITTPGLHAPSNVYGNSFPSTDGQRGIYCTEQAALKEPNATTSTSSTGLFDNEIAVDDFDFESFDWDAFADAFHLG